MTRYEFIQKCMLQCNKSISFLGEEPKRYMYAQLKRMNEELVLLTKKQVKVSKKHTDKLLRRKK